MGTGNLIKTNGKKILLYRAYTNNGDLSSTEYLPATKFKVGVNNATPTITGNDLTNSIPIGNGTLNDDGTNTLTGSNGGDNTTDNNDNYKQGAGVVDGTSQNLIANDTSVTKTWSLTLTTFIDASLPFGFWFYLIDTSALGKLVSLKARLGSDTSNYYEKTILNADLNVGWNWINTNTDAVNTLTETGTVTGDVDTFILEVTTNNATDVFVAGDLMYDLLRQWEASDLIKSFVTSFPSINLLNLEVTTRAYLTSLEANGFLLDGLGFFNEDSSPLMTSEDTIAGASKSATDEFAFVAVDRVK